jgi:aspartyl/asparaginyl-tRNA synthetase
MKARRQKALCLILGLSLIALAGRDVLERRKLDDFVVQMKSEGLHVTSESAYEGEVESLSGTLKALYHGPKARVIIHNENDARILLDAAHLCPRRMEVITFLDLSAECFCCLEQRFPSADLVAVAPPTIFDSPMEAVSAPGTPMPEMGEMI